VRVEEVVVVDEDVGVTDGLPVALRAREDWGPSKRITMGWTRVAGERAEV
jgi:hypothetical protein